MLSLDKMLRKSVFLLILLISLEGISEARLTPISLLLPTPDKVITVTDNKGQITRYSYDMADRLVRVDYADGSYTSMTYDVVGRLTVGIEILSASEKANIKQLIIQAFEKVVVEKPVTA